MVPLQVAWHRLHDMSLGTQETARSELLSAIDDHNIPGIQDALKNYADVVQGVSLQIQARNLLARLLEGEADATIFQQMREMASKAAKASSPPTTPRPARSETTVAPLDAGPPEGVTVAALQEAIRRFWKLSDDAVVDLEEMLAFAKASRTRSSEAGWLLLVEDAACRSRVPDALRPAFD